MGRVGRVASRPLYDPVMGGGGKLDKRPRWALAGLIQRPPNYKANRAYRSRQNLLRCMRRGGGLAAVAFPLNRGDEFSALLISAAEGEPVKSRKETNEISGLETFATVAAATSLSEQLRGEGNGLFLDNIAAAGAWVKVPFRAPAALALIGGFRGYGAQLPASYWAEGATPHSGEGCYRRDQRIRVN